MLLLCENEFVLNTFIPVKNIYILNINLIFRIKISMTALLKYDKLLTLLTIFIPRLQKFINYKQ